jgi:hypothetical protein
LGIVAKAKLAKKVGNIKGAHVGATVLKIDELNAPAAIAAARVEEDITHLKIIVTYYKWTSTGKRSRRLGQGEWQRRFLPQQHMKMHPFIQSCDFR